MATLILPNWEIDEIHSHMKFPSSGPFERKPLDKAIS